MARTLVQGLGPAVGVELFPAEQSRIVQLLVQRIELKPDDLEKQLRTHVLGHIVQELGAVGAGFEKSA